MAKVSPGTQDAFLSQDHSLAAKASARRLNLRVKSPADGAVQHG